MSAKPAVAFHWLGGCGGCEESVLDIAEELPELLDSFEIAFFPMMVDQKRPDVEALPDASLAATFVSGSVVTEGHAEMARLLRRKSRTLLAFGSCAHLGGVPGLANLRGLEATVEAVWQCPPEAKTRGDMRSPDAPELPELVGDVRTLEQIVDVDGALPGCPPTAAMVARTIRAIIAGEPISHSRVLAPDVALCDDCPHKETRRPDVQFAGFRRPHWVRADPDQCLLNQGLMCLGPGTRAGCGAACINGNMPCTGCFGPTSHVRDQGAKLVAVLAACLSGEDEDTVRREISGIPDPTGSLYRYGLPGSLLRAGRH